MSSLPRRLPRAPPLTPTQWQHLPHPATWHAGAPACARCCTHPGWRWQDTRELAAHYRAGHWKLEPHAQSRHTVYGGEPPSRCPYCVADEN